MERELKETIMDTLVPRHKSPKVRVRVRVRVGLANLRIMDTLAKGRRTASVRRTLTPT